MRMLWVKCTRCSYEEEELLKSDEREVVCSKCGGVSRVLDEFNRRIHREGAHYKHVSWGLHHASE